MARPSAAQDGGNGEPASPPPVTHSWTRIVGVGREVITPMQLPSHTGHRPEGEAGPSMPSAVVGISINRSGAFGKRVARPARPGRRAPRRTRASIALYLADLDAIEGRPPDLALYRATVAERPRSLARRGRARRIALRPLLALGPRARARSSSGSRRVDGPAGAGGNRRAMPGRIARSSASTWTTARPRIAPGAAWASGDPFAIAAQAVELGVRHAHLARPDAGGDRPRDRDRRPAGRASRGVIPRSPITVGGGIRGIDDVLDA